MLSCLMLAVSCSGRRKEAENHEEEKGLDIAFGLSIVIFLLLVRGMTSSTGKEPFVT